MSYEIYAISDMHGRLPDPKTLPECDLLLIAGDVCPDFQSFEQWNWLDLQFRDWLNRLSSKAGHIVGIAGNHDFVFMNRNGVKDLHLPWHYLEDTSISIDHHIIHGIPWVPKLKRWAYYAHEKQIKRSYLQIPEDTTILLSHGPPLGYGDRTIDHIHAGSVSAAGALTNDLDIPTVVCGHIHEARGAYPITGTDTMVWNVASLDEMYVPVNDPWVTIV